MRLNRLSEISTNKDIYGESAAISCGVFCPTFGVAVAAPLIREAAVLVIGTAECTWYARNSCIYHSEEPGMRGFMPAFLKIPILFLAVVMASGPPCWRLPKIPRSAVFF